jgi:hypothetical protein
LRRSSLSAKLQGLLQDALTDTAHTETRHNTRQSAAPAGHSHVLIGRFILFVGGRIDAPSDNLIIGDTWRAQMNEIFMRNPRAARRGGTFRVFKRPPNELGPNSFNVAAGGPKEKILGADDEWRTGGQQVQSLDLYVLSTGSLTGQSIFPCARLLAAGLFIFTAAHNKSLSLSNEQVGGQSADFTISIHSFKSRAPGQPIKTHLVRPNGGAKRVERAVSRWLRGRVKHQNEQHHKVRMSEEIQDNVVLHVRTECEIGNISPGTRFMDHE